MENLMTGKPLENEAFKTAPLRTVRRRLRKSRFSRALRLIALQLLAANTSLYITQERLRKHFAHVPSRATLSGWRRDMCISSRNKGGRGRHA
jgi:hypothetical protein